MYKGFFSFAVPSKWSFSAASCSTSLQRTAAAAAVAGLDPGPANVQPWQLGTVLKELLDGDVTNVQLWCQWVFFLHGHSQLFKYLCGGRERQETRIDSFSHTRSTYTQANKWDIENQYYRLLKEQRAKTTDKHKILPQQAHQSWFRTGCQCRDSRDRLLIGLATYWVTGSRFQWAFFSFFSDYR